MSNMAQPIYRHSGKFPPYAPIVILGVGAVTGLAGGIVYGILDWLVPFIYLNSSVVVSRDVGPIA